LIEGLVFLDVNIPMYAAGQLHPYREPCAWLLTQVARGQIAAAIDTEIIQEILYRFGALQKWETAVTMANSLLELIPVIYPIRATEASLSVELFEQYAPKGPTARDMIHVAVMRNNGINRIISTDTHFERFEGITRLDPLHLFSPAR
jgi:hypothetical protein